MAGSLTPEPHFPHRPIPPAYRVVPFQSRFPFLSLEPVMAVRSDCCVIGGGIAGLTVARALARGGVRVSLVERARMGEGASRAAAGMLAPLVEARLEERSILEFGAEALAAYGGFIAELERESGLSVDFRSEGTLFVAVDRDQAELLEHLYREQRDLGLPVEWLTGYECRQREPFLAPGIPVGIHSPRDHQVDNRLLLAALERACRRLGVAIHDGVGNARVEPMGSGSFTVTAGDVAIEAGRIVIATGAYPELLREIVPAHARSIRPVKGQILRLDQSRMPVATQVIRSPEIYFAPKSDGRLVVGASSEEKGFDPSITAGEILELLRSAWECIPAIYELPIVETTVGYRPASIDHAPLLGPSGVDGVDLALGYYRHGILFAPLAAEILAAHIIGGRQSPWLRVFAPERLHEASIERTAG